MVRRTKPAVLLGLALVVLSSLPAASMAAPVDGLFISVPNPIDDKAYNLIKRKIEDAILTKKRSIQVVVFDFNPEGLPVATSDFNASHRLATYITKLPAAFHPLEISTVAFVQHQVTGHTVLPVVACQQLFMSDALDERKDYRAKLGNVSADGAAVFEPTIQAAYREQAERHPASDLVLRLLNRNLELKQVEFDAGGVQFLSPDTIARRKKDGAKVQSVSEPPPGLERGRALFDPDQARKFGLAAGIARSRPNLLSTLKLLPRALVEDHFIDQQVKAARFSITRLDKGTLNDLRNQVGTALKDRHNFLIFHMESGGGDIRDMAAFADWLSGLRINETSVPPRTVAYIGPKVNLGAGTFIALGCQEIVMGPESTLADFAYLSGADDKGRLKEIRDAMIPLAERRGYPAALFEAALTPGLALVHVKSKTDKSDERLLTAEQWQADRDRWENLGRIEAKEGELLKIPAARAKQWGIAVSTPTALNRLEDVYGYYGLDPRDVTLSTQGWLYRVAEFFRDPLVNFMLVMIGILGLILELKMPGTTIPGVISAVCFVLFFWSYSFVGEFTLLASLLFVLGLVLVGIEVFVLPGFGFTGVSGIFLIIASMVLVTLDNIPQTSEEWVTVGARLMTLSLGVVGALIAAFVLAYYLPSIPYASRMVLQPPDESEGEEAGHGMPTYAHLLGAIGVAATTLRPAGKAQFGEEFHDVIAEGDYVNPGSRVQVIEVEGNRVVVKEIS